jgi:RHS repeat-associated protein
VAAGEDGVANTYYYHNDHLGTPQKMTDASGTVVWSADYKPFGEATITVSTITNNLRFPGQYYDAETGLNYNYFRDYNPAIGRYVEADPIGLMGGSNPFIYVENNPLIIFDPYGLLDIKKMVDNLIKNRKPGARGRCASAVHKAMKDADGDMTLQENFAKDDGPLLKANGLNPIPNATFGVNYTPKIGDVVIWQNWTGQDPAAGHIQVYVGDNKWMAQDYQGRFDPNFKATNYTIYRKP